MPLDSEWQMGHKLKLALSLLLVTPSQAHPLGEYISWDPLLGTIYAGPLIAQSHLES